MAPYSPCLRGVEASLLLLVLTEVLVPTDQVLAGIALRVVLAVATDRARGPNTLAVTACVEGTLLVVAAGFARNTLLTMAGLLVRRAEPVLVGSAGADRAVGVTLAGLALGGLLTAAVLAPVRFADLIGNAGAIAGVGLALVHGLVAVEVADHLPTSETKIKDAYIVGAENL